MKNSKIILWSILLLLAFSCNGPSAEEISTVKRDEIAKADSISMVAAEKEAMKQKLMEESEPSNEATDKSNKPKDEATLAKTVSISTDLPIDRKIIKDVYLKFKVKNVVTTTEKIEDLAVRYNGFVTFSELSNNVQYENTFENRRDSLLWCKEYIVSNTMKVRVPSANLSAFVREMNQFIVFLDTRTFDFKDITIDFEANKKKAERYALHNKRQMNLIDNKPGKVGESTEAEDRRLERQLEQDNVITRNLEIEDKLKYSLVNIVIYQKPIMQKEVIADRYNNTFKPNFFVRAWDAIVVGFHILEEVILFFVKMWGVILLLYVTYVLIRKLIKKLRKK